MDLHLTDGEATLLARVIHERIGDYHMQIADADNSVFKETLRQEVAVLESVQRQLPAAG